MDTPKIVPQIEFVDLNEFIRGQNNFNLHFIQDEEQGHNLYRDHPPFIRFQKLYSELEQKTTATITNKWKNKIKYKNMFAIEDWTLLWDCYQKMSELVYESDPGNLNRKLPPDKHYLTR